MKILLPNGQIAEPQQAFPIPLFRLAFRPLFLLGGLFSIISVVLWSLMFSGKIQLEVYGGGYWWHIHEMLFGFVAAIICGFLLTAVQTWTKVPSIKGLPLIALTLVWLMARLLLLFPALVPSALIITIDMLFLPLAAAFLAYPILKVKLWRNLMFVPILLMMAVVNGAMHCAAAIPNTQYLIQASHIMVMLVTLVMCIMGGRVFPMFTANGTSTPKVLPLPWLEKLSIISVLLAIAVNLNLLPLDESIKGAIYLLAAITNGLRAYRWRIWVTFKTPLVWSLHISYWGIVIGFFMLALSELSQFVTKSQAIHAITVGGMGVMILAMISRVSLGHTGRKLVVNGAMVFAFIAISTAFLIRVFAPLFIDNYLNVLFAAAIAWAIAYGLFVIVYIPVLTKPRVDGFDG